MSDGTLRRVFGRVYVIEGKFNIQFDENEFKKLMKVSIFSLIILVYNSIKLSDKKSYSDYFSRC